MPTDVTRYTVLLSSPGDAAALCKVADGAIRAINRTHSATTGVELYPTDWRRDSRADSGAEPQALLNRQIVDDADIILAVFYQRYGTPTAGYGSGTEEEIRRGLGQGKTVLLYIWAPSAGFEPDDPEQFEKIGSLRDELGKAVMYKRFSNERELEQEVTHDLTRLVFELEGGGKSPKPSLSLVCLDENGKPASGTGTTEVRGGLAGLRLNDTAFDARVLDLFSEATVSGVRKNKAVEPTSTAPVANEHPALNLGSAAKGYGDAAKALSQLQSFQKSLANSAAWKAMQPTPVSFSPEDRQVVQSELASLGVQAPSDLFYVGNLGTIPAPYTIYGPSTSLSGSEDEKTKYRALQGLVEACRLRCDCRAFIEAFSNTGGISLSLANVGGRPATHVNVELIAPHEVLVSPKRAPVPTDYLIEHSLDDEELLGRFVGHLYSIGEPSSCRGYEASRVASESGGRVAPLHQMRYADPVHGRRALGREDFKEEVEYAFADYEITEDRDSGDAVVRLSFDRVQQNAIYAFPTVLLVKADFAGTFRYRITADELPHVVEGEISITAAGDGSGSEETVNTGDGAISSNSLRENDKTNSGDSRIRQDPKAGGEAEEDGAQPRRNKPMLTVPQQIAHLEAKGVSFDLCGKEEAASYLTSRTYLFKLMAYRELFGKRVGGERDGQYVGLDFGYLQELASLDRDLRYTLLPMTLDVEHFAHAKLMAKATELEGEDGCAVVADYTASLNHKERNRRTGEVKALRADIYCGDLVEKYSLPDEMPLWAYLELASFGSFIDLYLFCAERWEDGRMRDEHYLLRQAKACRNACAHSSDMLNGFGKVDPEIATNAGVSRALAEVGVSRRVRQSKMRNPRLKQIVTLLYLHGRIVPEGTSRHRVEESAAKLATSMRRVMKDIPHNDAVQSSLGFLVTLLDKWF